MKTIRRNTKKAKTIMTNAINVRVYSLSNNFDGSDFVTGAREWIAEKLESGAKLTHSHDDFYSIQVHSNLWYEFEAVI